MGGEIIAERFALLKTRGGNGLAFTHIVEDTLDGRRLVVKVSESLGALGLEYLKAGNLLAEAGVEGVLLPVEGGFLEEGGCYLAFPELGEPSLEHYLRMRPHLTCGEALFVLEGVLCALEGLHAAGFVHLFLEPRNVFYLPRRRVTLKDPALRPQFFHPFLEMVSSPDFSYLHPSLMDGGLPGAEADVYAVGRLAERLREAASDAADSPLAGVLEWLARTCTEEAVGGKEAVSCEAGEDGSGKYPKAGEGEDWKDRKAGKGYEKKAGKGVKDETGKCGAGGPSAGEVLEELRRRRAEAAERAVAAMAGGDGERPRREKRRLSRGGRRGVAATRGEKVFPRPGLALVAAWSALFLLALGMGAALAMRGWEGTGSRAGASGGGASGGSEAGSAAVRAVLGEVAREGGPGGDFATAGRDGVKAEETSPLAGTGDGYGSSVAAPGAEGAEGEQGATGNGGAGAGSTATPATDGTTGTSPPVASFTLSSTEGESPLSVLLDASASYDPDGRIVSYEWSCGRTGKVIHHVFESSIIPARIAVTLTVTDDSGRTASVTRCLTLY
ncbi:MAG: hypothetical protein H5T73_05170 [Actinobacteria bacterium]|nr:hypothetical protein [Actinomycetota bacterium]